MRRYFDTVLYLFDDPNFVQKSCPLAENYIRVAQLINNSNLSRKVIITYTKALVLVALITGTSEGIKKSLLFENLCVK